MRPNAFAAVGVVLLAPTVVCALFLLNAGPYVDAIVALWIYFGLPTMIAAIVMFWLNRPIRK